MDITDQGAQMEPLLATVRRCNGLDVILLTGFYSFAVQ